MGGDLRAGRASCSPLVLVNKKSDLSEKIGSVKVFDHYRGRIADQQVQDYTLSSKFIH